MSVPVESFTACCISSGEAALSLKPLVSPAARLPCGLCVLVAVAVQWPAAAGGRRQRPAIVLTVYSVLCIYYVLCTV
jgi:hypothetical protein